jgi:hypothetical protein
MILEVTGKRIIPNILLFLRLYLVLEINELTNTLAWNTRNSLYESIYTEFY